MSNPVEHAHQNIDKQLIACGWVLQDRSGLNHFGEMTRRLLYLVFPLLLLISCQPPATLVTVTSTPGVLAGTLPVGDTPTGCITWDQVDLTDEGLLLCVSGTVLQVVNIDDDAGNTLWYIIRFSQEETTFYIVQDRLRFDVQPGSCVSVTGPLLRDDNGIPTIENGDLQPC